MAKKKEDQTLPVNLENENEPSSTITYANEVIAIIAGLAASEVEGVAGHGFDGFFHALLGIMGAALNRSPVFHVQVQIDADLLCANLHLYPSRHIFVFDIQAGVDINH